MKFSANWLSKWVSLQVNVEDLCDLLTMAGLEVESITTLGDDLHDIVVGEVLQVEKHPQADRLSVCLVKINPEEKLNIVCGASNVREGLKVAVALIGAVLPNGMVIKKTKLRGVESCGMLCSEMELGLSDKSTGIMELSKDAPLGINLTEYISLKDKVIDLNITPNRGDCLSILGVAREVRALTDCVIFRPSQGEAGDIISSHSIHIDVLAKDACPRYLGRIISNIAFDCKTPIWLKECLKRGGLRPINIIVDIANYVMLELGQPLHAFDLGKIEGGIEVRFARDDEELTLLDGKTQKLNAKDLIIADHKKPIALAGIMGGKNSEVDLNSKAIFLESAFFDNVVISENTLRQNIKSDASYRFARGVDFNLQREAIERFTSILCEIAGCTKGPVIEIVSLEHLPKRDPITLRYIEIERILGVRLDQSLVVDVFRKLDMNYEVLTNGILVTPPSYRFDLTKEVDLIEEVARIIGYDKIYEAPLVMPLLGGDFSLAEKNRRLSQVMVNLGFREIITLSFSDPKMQSLFNETDEALTIANPISPEMSVMRTTLWPGLVNTLIHNSNRREERARFFEIGTVFISDRTSSDQNINEITMLSGLVAGDIYPLQWDLKRREVDFFDLKSDIEKIIKSSIDSLDCSFKPELHHALHPNISSGIYLKDRCVGIVGALHPSFVNTLDLKKTPFLFSLDLSILKEKTNFTFNKISRFPSVLRDLAIVLDKDISWASVQDKIKGVSGELLRKIELFDLYCGENIPAGKKSFGIRLTFQKMDRTLYEDEVDALLAAVISVLTKELGAKLRNF